MGPRRRQFTEILDAAVKHVMTTRFGEKHVSRDVRDKGSAKEAVSQGHNVIEGGALTRLEWARYKAIKDENGESVLKTSARSSDRFRDRRAGHCKYSSGQPDARDEALRLSYRRGVATAHNTPVVAQFIKDAENHIQGCFHKEFRGDRSKKGYKRVFGVITVNLAYHDPGNPFDNYQLLLHELAHNTLQSNDHLDKLFYDTVTDLGASWQSACWLTRSRSTSKRIALTLSMFSHS